jgi:chitodextrinase
MLTTNSLFRVLALAILIPSLLGAAQSGLGTARAAPSTALITGEIEQLTLTDPTDVWSAGTIVVGGQSITIPRNLLIDFPANRLTLQQTFVQAPPECVARGESGLAKADACNTSATGAIATIAANRTNGGNIIAGDVFFQKGAELISGVVTYINFTDGYFRLNGNPGDATTGVMVRLNDPTGRHSVQQGLGCASTAFNCSPDPRFTEDPDNYTQIFATGYPLCIPSTVPRPFTDALDFNNNGNTTETLTAQSNAAGADDLLCPAGNRPSLTALTVADSRRLAPLLVGDHLTANGNFETINGVHFLSAWHTTVSRALTTNGQPGQPDYMVLNEMFIDAPGFPRNRARDQFIGYTTQATSDVVIWSVHRDPSTNQAHEFPLATVKGCDAAAGAGTCTNVLGPNSFVIRGDIDFVRGAAKSVKQDPCLQLRDDPRFASANICPQGGTLAEEFAILSPMPHEVQARTGLKMADLAQPGGPTLRTFDITGRDAPNGQYLFPLGIGLGGIEMPTFVEVNINALDTPYNFEGLPWDLDRRLSPGGCAGTCESTPQPLDPFPFSGLDPRTQAPDMPSGPYSDPNYTASTLSQASNRILSFTDGTSGPTLGQFNGDTTVLSLALATDPPAQPIQPPPPLDERRGLIMGITPSAGPVGTTVIIDGSGLAGVTAVSFGGVPATTFSNLSSTQVSVVVPVGAQSGPIALTTATGTVTSATRFTVVAQPTISSVMPASGPVGTGLTITGSGFGSATDVSFNGTSATFTVVSDTAIRTAVPAGATSGPISVTTPGGTATSLADFTVIPPDTQPPTAPADLTATAASATQITLAWTAATDNVDVAGYNVFRDGGATPIATVTRTSFSDAGLAPSTTHSYTVVAFDAAGNQSPPSATASATTQADTQPPTAPADLTATAASATQITLAWTAATDDVGVAGYRVFRDGTTPIATVTGTSFSDTGLAAGSTHSYTVLAFDAADNQSAPSAAAAATTLAPLATSTPTALPADTATAPPTATSAVPTTGAPTPVAMTPTAMAGLDARPRPSATKTARPDRRREQPRVTVRVPRGIISHGAPVVVSVRTQPEADTRITLRLTRQGTRCTGSAWRRVCARVTIVLAQRVVHARANRQGLVTRSVLLGYSPASPLRATLGVRVSTPYGAVTHTAVVLLQPAPSRAQ